MKKKPRVDFRSAIGAPEGVVVEQSNNEFKEEDKNRSLRLMAKDRIQKFKPKTDVTAKTKIHRRRKKKSQAPSRIKEKTQDIMDIFDEEDSSLSSGENSLEFTGKTVNQRQIMPTQHVKSPNFETDLIKEKEVRPDLLRKLKMKKLLNEKSKTAVLQRRAKLKEKLLKKSLTPQKNIVNIEVSEKKIVYKDPKEESHSKANRVNSVLRRNKEFLSSCSEQDSSEEESSEDDGPSFSLKFIPKLKRDNDKSALVENKPKILNNTDDSNHIRVLEEISALEKVEQLKQEQQQKQNDIGMLHTNQKMPSDVDGQDELGEYEAWQIRQLKRLKEDLEKEHAHELEKVDVLRRRDLNADDLLLDNKRLIDEGIRPSEKTKEQMKFLQKYYHKGAFFLDEQTLKENEQKEGRIDPRRKQYKEATGNDLNHAELMPEFMQKRNYGKKSQSKWTHLSNEDTTKGNNLLKDAFRFKRESNAPQK